MKKSVKPQLPVMPPIAYMDEEGVVSKLLANKDKLIVIHFWATWCVPCLEEIPKLDDTQRKFLKDGFKVYALSLDMANIGKVREFYKTAGIKYLSIVMDANLSAFKALKLRGVPSTVFLNNKLEIISVYEKPVDWQSKEIQDFIISQIWSLNR